MAASLFSGHAPLTGAVADLFSHASIKTSGKTSKKPPPPATEPATAAAPPTPPPAEAPPTPQVSEAEVLARTVYVGNLPVDTTRKALRKHFAAYGTVSTARFRSASAANPKMGLRAAVITGEVVGDAISGYVVFADRQGAVAATRASGTIVFGRHLRIAPASRPGESSAAAARHDLRRSVFLGNLPFDIADETLWSLFGDCGEISYVRIVREPKTQQGKGFGYVGFDDEGAVERALKLHGTEVACAPQEGGSGKGKASGGRTIRVFRCSANKSHARLAKQEERRPGGGGTKRPRVEADDEPADGGGEAADGETSPHRGWLDRERRRLAKKVSGRAKKQADREREAKRPKALKGAIAKPGPTAKDRRMAKEKALERRQRSKLANGKKSAMGRVKAMNKGKGGAALARRGAAKAAAKGGKGKGGGKPLDSRGKKPRHVPRS